MSNTFSYKEILFYAEVKMQKYQPIEKVFNSTDKFVLILGENTALKNNIQEYMWSTKRKSAFQPDKMLASYVMDNSERVTFVFYDPLVRIIYPYDKLAGAIYLQRILLKQRIHVKVLCPLGVYRYSTANLCDNCFGFLNCQTKTPKPCIETYEAGDFLRNLAEKLKFELVDLSDQELALDIRYRRKIQTYFNEFYEDVANFAGMVCDYIAPPNAYTNTEIAMQNETYTRFQMTHSFRFIRKEDEESGLPIAQYLYQPDNMEEVFQLMNLTTDAIKPEWTNFTEKNRLINLLAPFRETNIKRNIFYEPRSTLKKEGTYYNIYAIDDILEMRRSLESYFFEKKIVDKFNDIFGNFTKSLILKHGDFFDKALKKLDTWVDENLNDVTKRNATFSTINDFFGNLTKKVDQYFGEKNALIIYYWFYYHQNRVPHDWQARLTGFGRNDEYWLIPEYDTKSLMDETIYDDIVTTSDFANVVDYFLRKQFEFLIDMPMLSDQVREIFSFLTSNCDPQNLKPFFIEWIIASRVLGNPKITPTMITVLQEMYQYRFSNVSIESLDCQKSLKRVVLFVIDNYETDVDPFKVMSNYDVNMNNIHDKLREQARLLYDDFIERTAYKLIDSERVIIDRTFANLSNHLIKAFRSRCEDTDAWRRIQPYQKLIKMQYTLENFEDFVFQVRIVFDSCHVKLPVEEVAYLQSLQNQFDQMENLTQKVMGDWRLETKWQWGHGFSNSLQKDLHSSAGSLGVPLRLGLRSEHKEIRPPCVGVPDINALLLLVNLAIMAFRKLFWNFAI